MIRSSLLEKMDITDASLAEGGYNYYLYVSRLDNSWAILRSNVAGTEFRYVIGVRDIDANWTARTSFVYKRPSEFSNGTRN